MSSTKNLDPVTNMTTRNARLILSKYHPSTKVSRVYDYGEVSDALLTLIPTFEYPDWSHHNIDYVLRYFDDVSVLRGIS